MTPLRGTSLYIVKLAPSVFLWSCKKLKISDKSLVLTIVREGNLNFWEDKVYSSRREALETYLKDESEISNLWKELLEMEISDGTKKCHLWL